MYAQLGSIVFEGLKGFESYNEMEAPNYAELSLVQNKPRLQRVGDALIELNVAMRLNRAFSDVDVDIQALRDAMNQGEVLPLVMGNGRYVGTFVIRSLGVEVLQTMPDGTSVEAMVTMPLLEFVDPNPLSAAAEKAKAQGFAVASNSPKQVTDVAFTTVYPAVSVSAGVRKSSGLIGKASDIINATKDNAAKVEAGYRKARKAVSQAQEGMRDVEKVLLEAQQLQTAAQSAVSQVEMASRNIDTMLERLQPPVDSNDLINATRSAQFAMSNVVTATSPISVLAATRQEK
jgi:phage protein U